jgi:putative transposase
MYKDKWRNYYFPSKPIKIDPKWVIVRKVGQKQLTLDAQLRLEWLIFYSTVAKGNAKLTACHFGISRKTLHKWLSRFNEKNLKSLEEVSRRPAKTRGWMVTRVEEERIIALRKQNIEYGKRKLKVIYQREYGESISTWKIERVIRRHRLYPDPVKHQYQVEKRANSKPKIRIHQVKEAITRIKKFGFLWHVDAIIIWWYGQRRVIFTALEEITKIAFARVYGTNSSSYAEDFLARLTYLAEGKIDISHQDNGGEFMGAFEKACRTLGILQIYSRVRTPTDNAALENFNGTIQREWLALSEVGLDNIDEANRDLTHWLIKYNSYRPHEALDYQTPLEYAQEQFFKVLPMWSASA